ncbi:MAG: NUDIX hydrolase [Acidimicrobiales bacterium]|nr:NUDIX hydrolase [Acidimicrobiales bacterium]
MSDALFIGANKDIAIRDASTVIMVREVDSGVEICMLMRNLNSDFVGGAYVFPGGAIDKSDYSSEFADLCPFFDDYKASQSLGLKEYGLGFFIAAIRESFEEAGILLASLPGEEEMVSMKDPARGALFHHYREELNAHRLDLLDIIKSEKLGLRPERLKFYSRWITPVGPPRRYDTRFFLVDAPKDQTAIHDKSETVDSVWIRPQDELNTN